MNKIKQCHIYETVAYVCCFIMSSINDQLLLFLIRVSAIFVQHILSFSKSQATLRDYAMQSSIVVGHFPMLVDVRKHGTLSGSVSALQPASHKITVELWKVILLSVAPMKGKQHGCHNFGKM